MKYSEAEKQIKALSSEYDVEVNKFIGNFVVNYKGSEAAYVSTERQYSICVWFWKYFKKMPLSNKLYMILSELAVTPPEERTEEKKHYVRICDGEFGYLNINISTNKMIVDEISEDSGYKIKFTDEDIEKLKQRDDIPLDWNKVTLEEVE